MARKRKTKQEPVKEWPKEETDLTRKYRPQTIDSLVGNAVLKKSLKAALSNNDVPHAILLQGPRGCGKTTIARILANELKCSRFDLKEIDVADFSGIATARQIRRTMNTRPMKGDVKVFILDEVALLGRGGASEKNEAQSALLKALEEPPSHCYFFLCTTDPQNVLNTIKSRCVHYTVSTLSEKQTFEFVTDIAEREDIELPKKVAIQIARDSLGHARDALKILQRVIYLDEEDMLKAAQQEAEKRHQTIALCRALTQKKSWKEMAGILKGLNDKPESIRRAIRGYFKNVLLNGQEWAFIVLDTFSEPLYNTDAENEIVKCVYECWKELND
jgi:DNA polymerase III gamma/tau subunit